MRLHRTHEIIAPWSTGTPVLDAARLAAVRVEPVLRQRRPALVLDLFLSSDAGTTVIPTVLVDAGAVADGDRDPLIFPAGTPGGDAFAAALIDALRAELRRLVLSGADVSEHVVRLRDAAVFDAARAAGCFGAAPLRDALPRLALYRYARRFVRGRRVLVDAPDAVGGWALLRDIARGGVAAGRRDVAATAWYGPAPDAPSDPQVALLAGDSATRAEIVLRAGAAPGSAHAVAAVDPLPLDVGLVFDAVQAPVRGWFAVERAPEPSAASAPASYAAIGGSGGRIAVVLGRTDGLALPDADTDEAVALSAALQREGFDAKIVATPDELGAADLIHILGVRGGSGVRTVVESARRRGIPVAIHAHDDDAAAGGWWGATVARMCFEYGSDESDVRRYLDLLAQRAVTLEAARPDVPFAPPGAQLEDASAALRDADIVYVASEAERDAVVRRSGRRGPIVVVPPLAPFDPARAPVGAITGPDSFALLHAPIGPASNALAVVRAAAEARIPLVVAGPVADASYLERLVEFGGPDLRVLPGEPPADLAAALLGAAAVYVDAAWVGNGSARSAAAAVAGARLVLADTRRFDVPGAFVRRFDPADLRSLSRALGEAWDDALRSPGRAGLATQNALAPAEVVRAIVRGYASAAAPAS